jgi:teichuronic acid biosynthesis glycosyltransferase TuaG
MKVFVMDKTDIFVKEKPLVSVIIPVYNRPDIILDAVESVQNQTYKNWELIIVDDASTDTTWQVIQDLAKQDNRIRVFRHEKNRSCGAGRNTGIVHAQGKYLAFLDSDDAWLPEKLEKQVRVFEQESPALGLVYTGVTIINDKGECREKGSVTGECAF